MKARLPSIQHITGFDGQSIECGLWTSQTGRTRQAVILLGDRQAADTLGHKTGASALLHQLDMRDAIGLAPNFGDAPLADAAHGLEAVFNHLRDHYGMTAGNVVLIGQGLGASRAAVFTHDHAPTLGALILDTPRFASLTLQDRTVMHRVLRDATAMIAPTLVLKTGNVFDRDAAAQQRLFDRLGSAVKDISPRPEHSRDLAQHINQFAARSLAAPAKAAPALRQADQAGYTADEYARLSQRLPWYSPRAWYWQATRAGLALAAPLSNGIKLGHQKGFDSGAMLDYVYRDEATGFGPLGCLIDRQYINAIGWRGIRQRKIHLEQLLIEANQRLGKAHRPTRLLDIAAGHGRYILDAVGQFEHQPERVQLRDFDHQNVADGRTLIAERGLGQIARFDQGDAFDANDLAALYGPDNRATLSVVSGLYELFPENDAVARSLGGVAAATAPDGYLVYTGQPWHPQLEMIARTLTSHRGGQAWTMRRRTQAEMDQLVRDAGFEKLTQRTDPWGIFTVSLARKL